LGVRITVQELGRTKLQAQAAAANTFNNIKKICPFFIHFIQFSLVVPTPLALVHIFAALAVFAGAWASFTFNILVNVPIITLN
jgi:hypothetical protein